MAIEFQLFHVSNNRCMWIPIKYLPENTQLQLEEEYDTLNFFKGVGVDGNAELYKLSGEIGDLHSLAFSVQGSLTLLFESDFSDNFPGFSLTFTVGPCGGNHINIGNGACNGNNNNEACHFDGGDCCSGADPLCWFCNATTCICHDLGEFLCAGTYIFNVYPWVDVRSTVANTLLTWLQAHVQWEQTAFVRLLITMKSATMMMATVAWIRRIALVIATLIWLIMIALVTWMAKQNVKVNIGHKKFTWLRVADSS